jgi:hypothetical protein
MYIENYCTVLYCFTISIIGDVMMRLHLLRSTLLFKAAQYS